MLQVVQAIKAGIEDPMVPYSQFVSGFLRFLVLFHVVLLSERAMLSPLASSFHLLRTWLKVFTFQPIWLTLFNNIVGLKKSRNDKSIDISTITIVNYGNLTINILNYKNIFCLNHYTVTMFAIT